MWRRKGLWIVLSHKEQVVAISKSIRQCICSNIRICSNTWFSTYSPLWRPGQSLTSTHPLHCTLHLSLSLWGCMIRCFPSLSLFQRLWLHDQMLGSDPQSDLLTMSFHSVLAAIYEESTFVKHDVHDLGRKL